MRVYAFVLTTLAACVPFAVAETGSGTTGGIGKGPSAGSASQIQGQGLQDRSPGTGQSMPQGVGQNRVPADPLQPIPAGPQAGQQAGQIGTGQGMGVSGQLNSGQLGHGPQQSTSAYGDSNLSGPDGWRYRWHNNHWWYWTRSNRWSYWDNDRWVEFDPNRAPPLTDQSVVQPAPAIGYSSSYGSYEPSFSGSTVYPYYGSGYRGDDGRSTSGVGWGWGRGWNGYGYGWRR